MVFSRISTRILLTLFFVAPLGVSAAQASLALSPKDGTFVVGNEFTVGVVLDTGGVSVNAVEGKLRYLSDDISVVRVDSATSPVTSWTVAPDYTTEPGLISFGGVNPDGIKGKGKTLFSITFRVLRSGEARVRLASGAAILSEGGAGTNILTDLRGGTYTLVTDKGRVEALHGGPSLLRSSSHPDETAWYQSPDVSFEWSRTPVTDQVRFSVDQNPEGSPTATLAGDIEAKNVPLSSGIWYGHLALHDDSGWSPIGHLRLQIDTERPDVLRVLEVPRNTPDDPHPVISLEASDARSGISHYEIAVDGGAGARFEDDGNHRYTLSTLPPGEHVVLVRAFDRAGNSVSESVVISVAGLPLPVVEPLPGVVSVGGEVDLEGSVGEGMTSRVSIGFDGGASHNEDVASGPGGRFIHTFVFPQVGVYRIKVQAIDQRGATSEWTPEVLIRVQNRSLLGALGALSSGGGVLLSLVFLAAGLLVGVWYGRSLGGNLAPVRVTTRSSEGDEGPTSASLSVRAKNLTTLASGYVKGVLSKIPRRRSTQSNTPSNTFHTFEDVPPPPQRLTPHATLSQSLPPVHTLSLKRRSPDAPPHGPTVLGR